MKTGGWFSCDDTHVAPSTAESAVTPSAYVLFYQRRGNASRWGGLKLPPRTTEGK